MSISTNKWHDKIYRRYVNGCTMSNTSLPPKLPEKLIYCSLCGYRGVESEHDDKKHARNELIMPILFTISFFGLMIGISVMVFY